MSTAAGMLAQIWQRSTKQNVIRRYLSTTPSFTQAFTRQIRASNISEPAFLQPPFHSSGPVIHHSPFILTTAQKFGNVRTPPDNSKSIEPTSEELLAKLKEIEGTANKQLFTGYDQPDKLTRLVTDVMADLPPPAGVAVQAWKVRRVVEKKLISNQDVLCLKPIATEEADMKEDAMKITEPKKQAT